MTAVASLAAFLLTSRRAAATDAMAVALCEEGMKLVREDRWAEARPKLEESVRLSPDTRCEVNLAACYDNLNQLAKALAIYKNTEERVGKEGNAARERFVKTRIEELTLRVPTLRIKTSADAAKSGIEVRLDGTPVPAAAWDMPLPVDPGTHEILATGPGKDWFQKSLELAERQRETVEVPALRTIGPIAWPVRFLPEEGKTKWSLLGPKSEVLCQLPCLRGVPEDSDYRVHANWVSEGKEVSTDASLPGALPAWPGDPLTALISVSRSRAHVIPVVVGVILGIGGTILTSAGVAAGPSHYGGFIAGGLVLAGAGGAVTASSLAVSRWSTDIHFQNGWQKPASPTRETSHGLVLSW